MPSTPINLAVLVSGGGTTLQNLLDQIAAGRLEARISAVIGSRPGLKGLQRAADAKIPNFVVDRRADESPEHVSRKVFDLCADARADLVCLAGWLSLISVPPPFAGRVMNIHPALLPGPFGGKGMFGHHVHEAVIQYGCKVTGCTVHFVDDHYDAGPIIVQRTCPVLEQDTPQVLAARVFEQEKIAYPHAIRLYQRGALAIEGRRVRIAAEANET